MRAKAELIIAKKNFLHSSPKAQCDNTHMLEFLIAKKKPWGTGLEWRNNALRLLGGACTRHLYLNVAVLGAAFRGRVIGEWLALTRPRGFDVVGVNTLAD